MYQHPDVLWLNTSPSLLRFNLPIIKYLSHQVRIAQWEYRQEQDEPSSLDIAVELLDDYLSMIPQSVHLVGHSTCGLLGLLYSRKYPAKVRSLTLLGVGGNPSVDWVSYYYLLRQSLPCTRELILARMVKNLFGYQSSYYQKALIEILAKTLRDTLSPHSLYQQINLPSGGIASPLLVCGSKDDPIATTTQLQRWHSSLKKGDRLWQVQQGHHFFHYFQAQQVGNILLEFWDSQPQTLVWPIIIPVNQPINSAKLKDN
jgi:pimeloyl-ACP methyl ester carboxylesterase